VPNNRRVLFASDFNEFIGLLEAENPFFRLGRVRLHGVFGGEGVELAEQRRADRLLAAQRPVAQGGPDEEVALERLCQRRRSGRAALAGERRGEQCA
jgi:hypothetical protein